MRSILRLACLTALLPGCSDSGGPATTRRQPPPIGIAATPLEGTVTLPAGAAVRAEALTVQNWLGASDVEPNGSFRIARYNQGAVFATASGAQGPVLMGWLSDDQSTLSASSTAEALLYFASSMFTIEPQHVTAVFAAIRSDDNLPALATAVEAALAQATSVGGIAALVKTELAAAVESLTRGQGGSVQPAIIDPIDRRSGILVHEVSSGQLEVQNAYRRRAWAFLQRLGHRDRQGVFTPNPAEITDASVSPVAGASSLLDIITALGSGLYAPTTAGPLPIPVTPNDASSTDYAVTVVGLGFGQGDFDTTTPRQRERHALLVIQTLLFDVLGPYLAKAALPAVPDLEVQSVVENLQRSAGMLRLAQELGVQVPLIIEKVSRGDFQGAVLDLINTVRDNPGMQHLLIDAVDDAVRTVLGVPRALQAANFVADLFVVVAGVDLGLQLIDTIAQAYHISRSNHADRWTITAVRPRVSLTPEASRVLTAERQDFEVSIQDRDPDATYEYEWRSGNRLGKLLDFNGRFDFAVTTSSASVRYHPEPGVRGTDSVEVRAFQVVGSDRLPIGAAQARVQITGRNIIIDPGTVSLLTGEAQPFTARLDPPLTAGEIVFYRWRGTADYGTFDGELEQRTRRDNVLYEANHEGRFGSDTVRVEAFLLDHGFEEPLGEVTEEVRVEVRRSRIKGRFVLDTEIHSNGASFTSTALIEIPKLDDVATYTVTMHSGYDPAFWLDGKRFGTRTYPPFDRFGERMTQRPPGVAWIPLSSASTGVERMAETNAWMRSRFTRFVFDVELVFK